MADLSNLALYRRLAGASVAAQMQDRGAFAVQALVGFVVNVVEFGAIALLFRRFGPLGGWSLPELAMLYGLVHTSYAITDGTAGGFDNFGNMVRTGEFDRLLLRPRPTALQVAGHELQLRRLGRLAQGLLVLIWGLAHAPIAWTVPRALLLLACPLGGAALFYGVLVLQATLAFWTTETLEVMNVLTYGGVEQGQYPLSIYRRGFRDFFATVVPIACVNYFPLHAILARPDPLGSPAAVHWLSPLAGPLFLALSLCAWRAGERHYTSTGS